MANEKRLIDANALLEKIQYRLPFRDMVAEMINEIVEITRKQIVDAPTVDAVEVVHGHWKYGKWENGHWVKGNERCRCSVCHRDFAVDNLNIWHGCPQCLAKMDGGNEDGNL